MSGKYAWRSPLRLALPLLLPLAAMPLLGRDYALTQLAFVTSWAIAGLGLVLVVGQAGQLHLGQGASLALGAYAAALASAAGIGLPVALAAALLAGALAGLLAALPASRLGGIALGMSTLATALLVQEGLLRWEGLTGGAGGLAVPAAVLAGYACDTPLRQAVLGVLLLGACLFLCARLLASRQGRAWRALREDETAALACGIEAAAEKRRVFALGGALGGLGGALQAWLLGYLSPDAFGLGLSFQLLMLVFIGGARHPAGALWGALVMVALPQAIALVRDQLPGLPAGGVETALFGALLVAVVMWRPRGLAGDAAARPR